MNKKYIAPAIKTADVKPVILAGSGGGVDTGSAPGNEFNDGDVSYGKGSIFDLDD